MTVKVQSGEWESWVQQMRWNFNLDIQGESFPLQALSAIYMHS